MEEQLQSHLVALEALDKDLSGLDHTLHTLPSQIGHRVMVPVGQVAFIPGKIHRTNEILVKLGGGFSVWRSASQAREILSRRRMHVQQEIDQVRFYMNYNKNAKQEKTERTETNDDPFDGVSDPIEIREKYEPEMDEEKRKQCVRSEKTEMNPRALEDTILKMQLLSVLEDNFDLEDEAQMEEFELLIDEFVSSRDSKSTNKVVEDFTRTCNIKLSSAAKSGGAGKQVHFADEQDNLKPEPMVNKPDAFSGKIVERQEETATDVPSVSKPRKVSLFKQRQNK